MGGIYSTDIDRLSLMSTFPNFKEQDKKYGSLIKGMQHEKAERIKQRQLYPGAPKGQFKQFRHGLSSFIEALAKNVQDKGVKMKYQTHVEDIIIKNDNYEIVTDQYSEQFDGILITTPSSNIYEMVQSRSSF